MKALFRKHSFIWENLPKYCKSLPSFIIDDNLLLPKKYIHSVEETQTAEVTNEIMNQGMSDDSKTSRPLKKVTPQRKPQVKFTKSAKQNKIVLVNGL